MKPSDVMHQIPMMSPLMDFNAEKVAAWTAQALAETGDTWRAITWQEIEPLLDSSFSENDKRLFKKYLPVLDSEQKAMRIWAMALKLK